MIKTINNKIVNINKNRILGGNELSLKYDKEMRLSGTDVISWGNRANGWNFQQNTSAKRPTIDTSKRAVRFTSANDEKLPSNKPFNYLQPHFVSCFLWVDSLPTTSNVFYSIRIDSVTFMRFEVNKTDTTTFGFVPEFYQSSADRKGTVRIAQKGTFNIGEWVHFLAYVDANKIILWGNGKQLYWYYNANRTINPDLPIYLGGRQPFTSSGFNGWIDDVKIIKLKQEDNSYLTTDIGQVGGDTIFTPPPRQGDTTPVLQLQSNCLSNQKIKLNGSNQIDELIDVRNKHVFISPSGKELQYNFTEQAFELSRGTDYMDSDFVFDYANPFTFEFYYKAKTYGSINMYLFNSWVNTDNNNYMTLRYQWLLNYLDFRVVFSGLSENLRGQNQIGINDTDWHHFLVCFDGETYTQYTDGMIERVATWASIGTAKDTPLSIGALWGSFQALNGYLDAIIIIPSCANKLVGWTGSALKYSVATNEQVFTPKSRNFPNLIS